MTKVTHPTLKRIRFIGLAVIAVLVITPMLAPAVPARAANVIFVNSAADVVADDGQCTLREALLAADMNTASGTRAGECPAGIPGLDYIWFRIGNGGPQTITLAPGSFGLLVGNEPVVIDGTTQLGYVDTPLIRLDGGYMPDTNGLTLKNSSSGSTVRGLMFTRFAGGALELWDSNGHTIQNNYIGTDGSTALGSDSPGILIYHSSNNLIGGAAWQGNVISGNDDPSSINCGEGISIDGAGGSSFGNKIQGNLIGTDPTGSFAIPNCIGVAVYNTPNNQIGGSSLNDEGNLISGNNFLGIAVDGAGSTGTKILSNKIGTDITGLNPLANSSGIWAMGGSIQISGNVIAFNSYYSINVPFPNTYTVYLYSSRYNCMHDNPMGVRNTQSSGINLTYNWWGDPSGPSGAAPGYGDPVTSNVLFKPFLTDPSSVCPF